MRKQRGGNLWNKGDSSTQQLSRLRLTLPLQSTEPGSNRHPRVTTDTARTTAGSRRVAHKAGAANRDVGPHCNEATARAGRRVALKVKVGQIKGALREIHTWTREGVGVGRNGVLTN